MDSFYFIMKLYAVFTRKNRLIKVILMSALNIPFQKAFFINL